MPLPNLSKSWIFDVGRAVTGGSMVNTNLVRQVVLDMLATMFGFSVYPWVCRGSSDSTEAGMDGVNRIQTIADIVLPPSAGSSDPQSWIVVRNAGGNDVLLRPIADGSGGINLHVSISRAGFTGGSTTAPPTATDQSVVGGAAIPWLSSFAAAPAVRRMQALHSTDGRETRIFLTGLGNVLHTAWLFGEFESAPAELTANFYAHIDFGLGYPWGSAERAATITPAGAVLAAFACEHTPAVSVSSEAYVGLATNLTIDNDLNGEWTLGRLAMLHTNSQPYAYFGLLRDVWVGSRTHAVGTTHPVGTSRTFCTMGNYVIPWNGSAPVVV